VLGTGCSCGGKCDGGARRKPGTAQKYQGTLFLVTHDHDLLEETATRIWRVSAKGIEDFKGAYEELQAVGA
jgi:ABC-type transporter Mla maintaining outer membrane lipid asymmetry ATPase subunit MlaF